MACYLLLGAGFSRNWGGWLANEAFEYLLGCPEVVQNSDLKNLLWQHQASGGFEYALAKVRVKYDLDPSQNNLSNLLGLQDAIKRMFDEMNKGFAGKEGLEFNNDPKKILGSFLTRFNAIFTLNQDLFLERHYINHENYFPTSGDAAGPMRAKSRWQGSILPGMRSRIGYFSNCAEGDWTPAPIKEFFLEDAKQPYFKLHGSSNWREIHGEQMLIIGANKLKDIGFFPVLLRYQEIFENSLCSPNARLMVIGYSFRDRHINEVIIRAIEQHGLQLFIIDPAGAGLAENAEERTVAAMTGPPPLQNAFRKGLVGASRRSLSEIFGKDSIEYQKVMRFFAEGVEAGAKVPVDSTETAKVD